jgi:hypothetical protein
VVSSITITAAEPSMLPALARLSKSMRMPLSAAVSMGADAPPGMNALSARPRYMPPQPSRSSWKVTPIGYSYVPGRSTWPEIA